MTQLDLELKLCKENFRFFIGYCYSHIYKLPFTFYEFHNQLCDIMLDAPNTKRIIINAPPRIGKTEIVKHYIAWRFLNNPASSVIYVSYEERLVVRKNREIQDLLKWLAKHFTIQDLKLVGNAKGKTEWVNHAQGTIIARGSNNGLTGGGCSTIMVLDDPNKPNDRTSPAILDHRNTTFLNTIRNRINLPEVPIVIIQQRIAARDLSGFLLGGGSKESWQHYNFPAIKEDGSALCPERLPLEEIENYKSDPFTYHAQYLQQPLEMVGKLFKKESIIYSNTRPPINAMRIIHSVDASGKGEIGNDFNCIATIGFDGINYYVLEIQNFRSDITVLLTRCRELHERYPNTPFLFEMRANGGAAQQILRKEMSGVLETHPCKDKVNRATAVKYLFDGGNVHINVRGLIFGELQAQFTSFPHVKNDDIVDAVCQGIKWLSDLPTQTTVTKDIRRDLQRPIYRGRPS